MARKRMRRAASKDQQRRNRAARRSGFRNDYAYRKALRDPKVVEALRRAEGAKRLEPWARRELAALATSTKRAPHRAGSKDRARYWASLAQAVRRSGGNFSAVMAAVGSYKRRGRK